MSGDRRPPPNYDEGINFADLAATDEAFAKHYQNGKFNFQDPEAVQQLTLSLLARDFSLTLHLPSDRLCPPIPIRWSYILFLSRLLSPYPSKLTGLDIGTGASAIYSLLATSSSSPLSSSTHLHATDIDPHSLSFAARNIASNALSSRITLHHREPSSPLLPLDGLGIDNLDFTMCNPPFYAGQADLLSSAERKDAPPSAICTGADNEMICPGGDAGFVLRMVEESRRLGERVGWYTSMLGKLGSVYQVVEGIKQAGCGNWVVQVLKGGRRTRRWVVAWSWGEGRVGMGLVRGEEVPRGLWGWGTEQTVMAIGGKEEVRRRVEELMGELDLAWRWESADVGLGEARENVWSRAARRKRKRVEHSKAKDEGGEEQKAALAFKITVTEEGIDVRWLRGRDHVLFESFCGMLKRAMSAA
ncbi:hypothetical protein KVT40_006148 [Elsinoe batatas]|uniref:U6 small nuclear RNA (adenine-(43)-N(6))-methyltransferase n=1 Tax=Elsinoe batatas TaxID=2601811 RepID=A0A8K0KYI6_9PEZI|nr:hypothetical protein KVT40_006148 [Elsinoe batatas]